MRQYRDTRYYITEEGKIYSYWPKRKVKSTTTGRNGKVYVRWFDRPEKWQLRKTVLNNKGYELLVCTLNGTRKTLSVHRMIAECYLGPIPKNKEVDHIDGNPSNNHVSNLQYLTREENMAKRNFSPCPSKQHSK